MTPVAFVSVMVGTGLMTTETWLVPGFQGVTRGVTEAERAVLQEMLRASYGATAISLLTTCLMGVALWSGRRRWAAGGQLRRSAVGLALAMFAGLACSASCLLWFHVQFATMPVAEMAPRHSMSATLWLIVGAGAASFSVLTGLTVGGWRALRAVLVYSARVADAREASSA